MTKINMKIFTILIFVCGICFLPKNVSALSLLDCSDDSCDYEAAIINGEDVKYYNDLKSAVYSVGETTETVIYLVNNIELEDSITISDGQNIVIDGQGKYYITRGKDSENNSYTGTFFIIAAGTETGNNNLMLKDLVLDAGAKWSLNENKINEIKNTNPSVATSATASDYYNLDDGSINSTETLLIVESYSNLNLVNTKVKNYMSNSATVFSVSSNGKINLSGITSIENNFLSGSAKIADVNGKLILEDNASIDDNVVISNGGISLINLSGGKLYLNDKSSISYNKVINSAYMIYMSSGAVVTMNEEKENNPGGEGTKITYNTSYPGPKTTLSTIFYNYNSNSGTLIMNAGEISNNTGGKYVVMDQRRALYELIWNGGVIKNNKSVYDNGTIISMRGSDIGKNMTIYDSVYIRLGGTDDLHYFTNAGTMNGEIFISQLNGVFTNTGSINADVTINSSYGGTTTMTGIINGNVTITNGANVLFTDTVNGDVYLQGNSTVDVNGIINGNIYVDMTSITKENPVTGNGTINGYLVIKYSGDTEPVIDVSTLTVNRDIIVYNVDTEILVEFVCDEDDISNGYKSNIYAMTKNSEEEVKVPTIEKEGYTLENWYLDEELTELWDGKTDISNMKLYAKWVKLDNPDTFDNIIYYVLFLFSSTSILSYLLKKKLYN